jgi:two-component system sporulation sensor kinase A
VFLDLVLNAVEAMPNGGRLTIRTRVEDRHPGLAERFVLVEFVDTGPGIPDHAAQAIFEPFYTTKHKGPGLGLAISYTIVERHEGTLSVSSSTSGTTFRVALPAVEVAEFASGEEASRGGAPPVRH